MIRGLLADGVCVVMARRGTVGAGALLAWVDDGAQAAVGAAEGCWLIGRAFAGGP